MNIYYSLLFATFLSLLYFYRSSKNYDLILSVCIFIYFGLFAGLRYFADADYSNYSFIFDSTPLISDFNANTIAGLHGEVGFLLVLSLFKSAGLDYFIFVLLSAFVSLWGKIYFYKKIVGTASLGVCLYFCLHFINIEFITIRWALATSFILLGFYCKYNKSYYLSALFFFFAICFHYYSILYILLAIIPLQKFKVNFYFKLFLVVVSISLIQKLFGFSFVISTLNSPFYIVARIIRYLTFVESQVGIISILRVFMYVILIYYYFYTEKELFSDKTTYFFYTLSMLTLTISVMFLSLPIFFFRSIVLADLISIALILRLSVKSRRYIQINAMISYGLTFVLMLWCAIDIDKKLTSQTISEYRSWFLQWI